MKKIAFICVHNTCCSQIAEALGKHLVSDIFESYSEGLLMIIVDLMIQAENQMRNLKPLFYRSKEEFLN